MIMVVQYNELLENLDQEVSWRFQLSLVIYSYGFAVNEMPGIMFSILVTQHHPQPFKLRTKNQDYISSFPTFSPISNFQLVGKKMKRCTDHKSDSSCFLEGFRIPWELLLCNIYLFAIHAGEETKQRSL